MGTLPKLIQQLVTPDQSFRIAQKVHKQSEYRGLEVDGCAVAQQLSGAQVDAEWPECVHR
jgi:hypothetical protein